MPNIGSMLNTRLDEQKVRPLQEIGACADEEGVEVYLVGGLVRDLLFGVTPGSPDLSVVGNGKAFAEKIADRLKGSVSIGPQFETFVVQLKQLTIEVATARSEIYEYPGALPKTAPADIEQDLKRRDFSTNAMAVALNSERWGLLIDPSGGFSDCSRRKLRILHDKSISDDPIRALRAVRYMARLRCSLADQTRSAIIRDADKFTFLSGARIREELAKLLQESTRTEAIKKAEKLGILAAIEPAIRVGQTSFEAMNNPLDGAGLKYYIACISLSLTLQEAEITARRLDAPEEWTKTLLSGPRLQAVQPLLRKDHLTPSEVVTLLEDVEVECLKAHSQAYPNSIQTRWIRQYLSNYRHIQSEVGCDDLIRVGLAPNSDVDKILKELRLARLDKRLNSKEEELAFAKRLAAIIRADEDRKVETGEPAL